MAGAATPSKPPRRAARAWPTGPAPLWAVRGAAGPGSVSRATRARQDRARSATPTRGRWPTPVPWARGALGAPCCDMKQQSTVEPGPGVVNFPVLCDASASCMDVRCERCKTLYELDDTRVSEAGTTVRCTTCGHVFRVRKKVLLMTDAVGDGGECPAGPAPRGVD